MDLKQQLMNKAFQMMQDPRVAKALQNPKVMEGLMGALKLRSQVQKNLDEGVKRIAKGLNLATESEVKELRRALHRLERELEHERGAKKSARKERSTE
ncbi:MAG TPA: hypothetical protein VF331_10420 [Polyangiales bacterium]